jgi:hypothetical protein
MPMSRVLISDPVAETRELLERLVRRMGHDIVGVERLEAVDVLLFAPDSPPDLALARRLLRARPDARLVACSTAPQHPPDLPRLVGSLLHPFSPADLERVLADATAGP